MAKPRSTKQTRARREDESPVTRKRAKLTPEAKDIETEERGPSEIEGLCVSLAKEKEIENAEKESDLYQLVRSVKDGIDQNSTSPHELLALQRGQGPKIEEVAAQWSREKEDLEQRLESKQQELEECVAELGLFQERFLKCEDSRWAPEGDQPIAFAVKNLHASIRAWARKYSIESFKAPLSPKKPQAEWVRQQSFLHWVRQVTSIKDWWSLVEMDHPFLVLAALLSDFLLRAIFGDPFIHFRDPKNKFGDYTFRMMAKKMFQQMEKVDVSQASAFRVNILRQQFPDDCHPQIARSEPGEVLCPKSMAKGDLKATYDYMRRKFLYGRPPIWMLRDRDDDENKAMDQSLCQILHQAGNLHLRLLTHRTHFEWVPPRTYVGKSFRVKDPALQADQVNDVVDEKDETWDGEKIQMVVGTGLVARGDVYGNNYAKQRIIAPSRVCLQNDWS
ncbi:hypothetical protein IWZ00DRAFT_571596 [Phyllosticta capitalensis]